MKSWTETKERIILAWKIVTDQDSNLIKHIKSETSHWNTGKNDPDNWMRTHLIDMGRVFSTGGHSGASAFYATEVLRNVLSFEPIYPLTGEDSEWGEPFDNEGTRQNKRCSRIFKNKDGIAYDTEGVVYENSDYGYNCRESLVKVAFPYKPKTVRVKVDDDSTSEERIEAVKIQAPHLELLYN